MLPQTLLARRTRRMGASAIREILKVVSRPGMISLAGGIPAPESIPLEIIGGLTARVLEKYGAGALQYDHTEGFPPLRESLSTYLAGKGMVAAPDEILIASGSQGVLDGLGKILIDPGDAVAVEAPTYLGALQAFTPYTPTYLQVATDDQGMRPDALADLLARHRVKFIYLVPNFQNPTGRTLPLARRRAIADIVRRHATLLIEDDPYGDLRYRGQALPAIKTMLPEQVVYVSTLSKIFAPGLRMGFCLAPQPVHQWLVLAKQGVDLHTSTFNQALAAEYITGGYLKRHLPQIVALYRPRQQAMLDAMQRFFPEEFTWSVPDGGMFIWVEGPTGMDMERVNRAAVARNTAFVPGTFFFANPGDGRETLRLNYTMVDPATISRAVKILGEVFAASLADMDGRSVPSAGLISQAAMTC